MLFADWEVRTLKNCDRRLENAAQSCWPRTEFPSSKSQFFTLLTDPMPVNNLFTFASYVTFIAVSFSIHTSRSVLWSKIGKSGPG